MCRVILGHTLWFGPRSVTEWGCAGPWLSDVSSRRGVLQKAFFIGGLPSVCGFLPRFSFWNRSEQGRVGLARIKGYQNTTFATKSRHFIPDGDLQWRERTKTRG